MTDRAREIGQRIRGLRLKKDLSQAELGASLKIPLSDSYISLVESGKRSATPQVLAHIATRLNTSVRYLQDGTEGIVADAWQKQLNEVLHVIRSGRHQDALRRLDDLTGFTPLPKRPDLQQFAVLIRARALEEVGELGQAAEQLRRLLPHVTPGESAWADAHAGLARCLRRAGDAPGAIVVARNALGDHWRLIGNNHDDAYLVVATQLMAASALHEPVLARRLATELVNRLDGQRPARIQYMVYWHAAHVLAGNDEFERAETWAAQAVDTASQAQIASGTVLAISYADFALSAGEETAIRRALRMLQATGLSAAEDEPPQASAAWITSVARCRLAVGDVNGVVAIVPELLAMTKDARAGVRGQALAACGTAFAACGKQDSAIMAFAQAAPLLDGAGLGDDAAMAWWALADLYVATSPEKNRSKRAATAMRNALASAGLVAPARAQEPYVRADAPSCGEQARLGLGR